MSSASDYLEDKVLDHTLGNAAFSQPATLYLGLWTADNGLEAGTLTGEVSGGSYLREPVTFGNSASGTAATDATVTFATATANWGTITHVAIMDSPTAGNVLYHGTVSSAKLIESADTFQVSAGNLTVSMN